MAQASSTRSLEDARKRAFANAVAAIAAEQQVQVEVRSSSISTQTENNSIYNVNGTFIEVVEMSTGKRTLKSLAFEEEYWQKQELANRNIQYESWILLRMPKTANVNYRREQYGFAPVWRSALVPGLGQLYKKQNTKGISLLAVTGAITVGTIVADNQKTSNYENALKTRDINERRAFLATSDNWENARNALIGVGGAVYIYNLVDAIASKGAKLYAFKDSNRPMEFQPYYAYSHSGLNLTIHLK